MFKPFLIFLMAVAAITAWGVDASAQSYGPIGHRLHWKSPPTYYVKVPPRDAVNVPECVVELDIYVRSAHLEGTRTKGERRRHGWLRLIDGADPHNPFGYKSFQRRPFGKELASYDPHAFDSNDWDDLYAGPIVFSANRTIYVYGWGCD